MLEQMKDKYSILIEELENLIITLDKKIERNGERKSELIKSYDEDVSRKNASSQELESTEMNLNYLRRFEGKNIFITSIKEAFKSSAISIKGEPTFSKCFLMALLGIFTMLSFADPIFFLAFTSLIGTVFCVFGLYISFDIKGRRKLHSIADLENKKKELEEELKEIETRLKSSETVDKSIIQERLKLNALKEECLKTIEYIRNSRGLAIESLVPSEVLNEAYDNNEALKGVKQRIREIEKEGLV